MIFESFSSFFILFAIAKPGLICPAVPAAAAVQTALWTRPHHPLYRDAMRFRKPSRARRLLIRRAGVQYFPHAAGAAAAESPAILSAHLW